jgi:DNA-binding NtrC family response regulator
MSTRLIMNALQPEPHVALIVEDDPDVRALAAVLLEEMPLDVVEVASAEAALNCLQERGGEVAMLFADVRLPGKMDGVQLAKAASTLWPTVRIVLTSGDPSAGLGDMPDCVTFMPKPWRGLDVLMQAEQAIHKPHPMVT